MSEVKTTMDEARELVADPVLWPKIRDLLWDFAPQVHGSWIAGIDGHDALPDLASLLPSSHRLKVFVLSSLGVEPCFHAFPKDDWSRLLLLDGAALLSIAKWLGALACADALRRVTGGAAVRELKAGLHGVYPEVFGFTAYFKGLSSCGVAEVQGPQEVVESGCRMLFSIVHGLAEPLRRRFELNLPKTLCEACQAAPSLEMDAGAVRKLLKLKFPEAYRICC